MKGLCLIIFVFLNCGLNLIQAQLDTTIFTFDTYLKQVIKHHPLAKQADLKTKMAAAKWLSAKGNFDPIVKSNWSQKNFDKKLYYRQFQNKITIPTQLGLDVVAGYENTEGLFLNPENKTDKYGLWNLGIEANLLQGLLIDERRTVLKQAKIYQNIAENQRQILLNELLYKATLAYLNWQQNYYTQQVITENITISETYYQNTTLSFEQGEKTGMDTLEAFILWQDAQVFLQKNQAKLVKSRQVLENYLWYEDKPLALKNNIKPSLYQQPIFEINPINNLQNTIARHPQILEKQNKQASYEVAQRMKREKLKPKLKLKYNPLLATSENSIRPNFSLGDYKWGFDFSIPIFLRSERAAIQEGEIKIEETVLDIQNKRNELQNKIEGSLQYQRILQAQLTLQKQNIRGYQQLLNAENEKFSYGESSVFLLNKRQEKYINGQLKLIKTYLKFQMEILNYLYYTNGLLDN